MDEGVIERCVNVANRKALFTFTELRPLRNLFGNNCLTLFRCHSRPSAGYTQYPSMPVLWPTRASAWTPRTPCHVTAAGHGCGRRLRLGRRTCARQLLRRQQERICSLGRQNVDRNTECPISRLPAAPGRASSISQMDADSLNTKIGDWMHRSCTRKIVDDARLGCVSVFVRCQIDDLN